MKKLFPGKIAPALTGVFLFFACASACAQQQVIKEKNLSLSSTTVSRNFDEAHMRKKMQEDGVPGPVIDKIIAERKLMMQRGDAMQCISMKKTLPPPGIMGSCPDMGAENGWAQWQGAHGTNNGSNPPIWNPAPSNPPPAPTGNNQISITSGTGIDPCTPGTAPGAPTIPVVAPGFGNASIQLGVSQQPGCYAEQIIFPLTPTPADTNFIYAFAAVLYDPTTGHALNEKPAVDFVILDPTGDTVPCSYQHYISAPNMPGFFQANTGCMGFPDTWYRPWTTVGVNLANYVNQNLTVIITNTDCVWCGHYAHSYWDFQCPPVSGNFTPFCLGQQTTLCGPTPYTQSNPYTYSWYVNTQPYNPNNPWTPIAGSGNCVTVTPQVGDTFAVHVQQNSGCNFWIPFTPQPTTVLPDFTFAGNCGQMTFTDISTVSPPSTTNSVTQWNWQFPGGSPSSSTLQNPGVITYPPGTYTVTLTVTSSAGCSNTISHTITVGGFPTAAFIPTTPCLGVATSLNDGSVAPGGDPIVSWNWSMPGGTPATASSQNTSTTYGTAGTHTVTLIVTTQQGCKDTVTQQVLVYNPPIANFSGPIAGCAPVCNNYTDLSNPVDGTITNWVWSFPGGMPSVSTTQNPQNICYNAPGSYGATLIVTTNYGCKDTLTINPLVNVYAWPTAEFCVTPNPAPVTDPVFQFCDLWSNDVVSWTWHFGDNDSDIVNTDPIHSYSAVVTNNDFYSFNICLKVTNVNGCWDTVCHTVELIPEFTFYIPNTFTPNSDFINEMFFGKCRGVKEYNIWLFDRWGNLIWDCYKEDKNTNWDNQGQDGLSSFCKWDGKVQNKGMDMNGSSNQLAQEDVYVWKVRLTDIFDKKHTYIGHVNIVR